MPDYRQAATRIARKHGIPPGLFAALINQESGFNPRARSPAGAIGLGQLMPGTARGLGVNPLNPIQNLEGSARYLAKAYQSFKSWPLALAAYNAGFGAVHKYGGVPPYSETKNYVRSIMSHTGVSAGGPALMAPNVLMPGGGSGAMNAYRRQVAQRNKLQTLLQPDPLVGNLLQKTVGEHVADLFRKPINLPPIPQPAGGGGFGLGVGTFTGGQAQIPKNWRKFVALAPGADRPGVSTQAPVLAFVGALGRMAGTRLTIGTGTRHSQMTVNGRQSAHWTGHAADIPASGRKLRQLGYLALIEAGMSRSEAARARRTGGLFNVGNYQIIFATDEGGNHYNHLHVGVR